MSSLVVMPRKPLATSITKRGPEKYRDVTPPTVKNIPGPAYSSNLKLWQRVVSRIRN